MHEKMLFKDGVVLAFTYRSGTIKQKVPGLPARCRDSTSPEFSDLKRRVAALVMEEQRYALNAQYQDR